jgi:hypothetical protein
VCRAWGREGRHLAITPDRRRLSPIMIPSTSQGMARDSTAPSSSGRASPAEYVAAKSNGWPSSHSPSRAATSVAMRRKVNFLLAALLHAMGMVRTKTFIYLVLVERPARK